MPMFFFEKQTSFEKKNDQTKKKRAQHGSYGEKPDETEDLGADGHVCNGKANYRHAHR
jgi:hypothetical protein